MEYSRYVASRIGTNHTDRASQEYLQLIVEKEAHTGILDLSADDPYVLERSLSFVYTTSYDECDKDNTKGTIRHSESSIESVAASSSVISGHNKDSTLPPLSALSIPQPGQKRKYVDEDAERKAANALNLLNNVLVYALADKYDVKALKTLARANF